MELSEVIKMKDRDGQPCPTALFDKLLALSSLGLEPMGFISATVNRLEGDRLDLDWDVIKSDIDNIVRMFGIKFKVNLGLDREDRFELMDFEDGDE